MKNHLITFAVIIYVLIRLVPQWLGNFSEEGREFSAEVVETYEQQKVSLPDPENNTLVIFWASWCGPCKIEMSRLQSSIDSKKIDAKQVFALNPFENEKTIRKFIEENQYQFRFVKKSSLSSDMEINQTPTTILFHKNKINHMSSGMSIIGIWRAEMFL